MKGPAAILSVALLAWAASVGAAERVSLAWDGAELDDHSEVVGVSANGRLVVFASEATNAVPGDLDGGLRDLFLRDRLLGTTRLVSLAADGAPLRAECRGYGLTPDGRHLVLDTNAGNALPDGNLGWHLFVKDLETGALDLVDQSTSGTPGVPAPYINGEISDDGRFVAFTSYAVNLDPPDREGLSLFLRDRVARITRNIARDRIGRDVIVDGRVSMSGDGRFIAYSSADPGIVERDFGTDHDVFVWDRLTGATERASLGPDGIEPVGESAYSGLFSSISRDGAVVAFDSRAANLAPYDVNEGTDVFVRLRASGETRLVSRGRAGLDLGRQSTRPVLSADGRFVAMTSQLSTLAPGEVDGTYQLYVVERSTGRAVRLTEGPSGPAELGGAVPRFSADGRWVAFQSSSGDLVPGDTGGFLDVFVGRNTLLGGGGS